VVAANVVLDPQQMCGTDLVSKTPNINDRYVHYRDFRKAAANIGGLMFGSRRAATPSRWTRWRPGTVA
jgi:hypothetical protein